LYDQACSSVCYPEEAIRVDVARYLERIGYAGSLEPTLATLRGLHEAHYRAVPFENLDIALGRPITLDEAALFAKIVERRRGGFCYELNGLFAALLRALGFRVTLLSAGVLSSLHGVFGPEFDHLALRVDLAEPWLADIGFGEGFVYPLRLDERGEQHDPGRVFRITERDDWHILEARDDAGNLQSQYRFTLTPRALADFAAMCHYQQTSPDSGFTKRSTCSLPTPTGRVTLSGSRLILTNNGVREETELPGEAARAAALRERFGIVL
jgi:N-hydroxyarylamine O-acetyltransferase